MPLHLHPGMRPKSTAEMGVAQASRTSKLPVPGGMYMTAGQSQVSGAAEGMTT